MDKKRIYQEARIQYRLLLDEEKYKPELFEKYCERFFGEEKIDKYVIRTRWHITASKLKCFIKNPEEYYIRYILELPNLIEKESKALVIGNAFEDVATKWLLWFSEKYTYEKNYVKWQLIDFIMSKEIYSDPIIAQWRKKELEKMKKEDLQAMMPPNEKIKITSAEYKAILGMYYEVNKQEAFDVSWEYEYQKQMFARYESLNLSWSFDRYQSGLIRDYKSSGQIDRFEYDMENTFDYIIQMAFYFTLAFINTKQKHKVYLDVVETKAPHFSLVYEVSEETLLHKMQTEIKPALDGLIRAIETDERVCSDRFIAWNSSYYPIMRSAPLQGTQKV